MSEPTREQIEHLIEKRDRAKGLYAVEIMVRVDALRALLDAYEERGREVERQELKLAEVNFSRDAWKARAEKAEAEIERLEKLIDYLEQYGPKPLNERLEQAEAEVERLRADLTQAQAEANVRGDRVVEYRERWQKAKERLAKVVERVRLAAGTLQLITDALSERCRKDLPHDHTMLRQARATLELLDAAAQPEEKRRG